MMIRCPNCGTEVKPTAKFCSECGSKLSNLCPGCGAEYQPEAKFCSECGTKLPTPTSSPSEDKDKPVPKSTKAVTETLPPPPSEDSEDSKDPEDPEDPEGSRAVKLKSYIPKALADKIIASKGQVEGERRQVTMLFADVTDSTKIGERLDPEEVIDLMNQAFELLCKPVYRYEGLVARLMGDGILAFFGAPVAHENDPERAVRTALDIQEGVKNYAQELKQKKGIDFEVRVGINTGIVVVGDVGSDLRMEYTVMGNAVNIAKRMESAARPGGILISENTYRFVKPIFEFIDIGAIQVKGISEPIEAYEVVGLKPERGELRGLALEGIKSKLVGRDQELSKLKAVFNELCAGKGQIVSLIGEMGLGKSRLMAEFKKHTIQNSQKDIIWLEGRAYSYTTAISYWIILEIIRSILEVTAETPEAEVRRKLKEKVEELLPNNWDEVLPYLGNLLSLKLERELEAKVKYLDAEALRRQIFYSVKELFTKLAEQKPLILIFEDLHWSDRASIELIEQLMSAADVAPIMLCGVFRPLRSELCWRFKIKAEIDFPYRYTEVILAPLPEKDGQKLLANLLQIEGLPENFKAQILNKADGNPFFVEEMIRSLIDSGLLLQEAGRWKLTGEVDKITVPNSLQAVIQSRIDQLEEEAKRILQMASVIGRVFLYRVLDYIAQSEQQLQAAFSKLQRVELIRERNRIPELEYIFKHALTQEVAYENLLLKRRQEYHRRVGECLERIYGNNLDGYYEILAHHYKLGEVWEKALEYNIKAGEKSKRIYANQEAVKYYTQAIEISRLYNLSLNDLPTILANRGEIYITIGDYNNSERDYQDMISIAQSIGDRNKEGTAYIGLGQVRRLKGKIQEAMDYFKRAYELGQETSDKRIQASSLCRIAALQVNTGSLAQALEASKLAYELSLELPDKGLMRESLTQIGLVNSVKGDFNEALGSLETALKIAKENEDRAGEAAILNNIGIIHFRTGKYDEAVKFVEAYLKVSREIGNKPAMLGALNNVSYGYMLKGAYDKCLRNTIEALEIAKQMSDKRLIAISSTNVGEAHQVIGNIENAIKYHQEALAINKELGFNNNMAEVLVALGLDYMQQEQYDRALEAFNEAYALAEKIGYNEYKVKALLGIAEVYLFYGDRERSFVDCDRALELAAQIKSKENMAKGLALRGLCGSQSDDVETSLQLAEELQNPALKWELHKILAEVYKKLERPLDSIIEYAKAQEIIMQIASKIEDPSVRDSYLNSKPVRSVFGALVASE